MFSIRIMRINMVAGFNYPVWIAQETEIIYTIVVYLDSFQKEVLRNFTHVFSWRFIHEANPAPCVLNVSIASSKESISSMLLTRLSQSLVDLSGAASQSAAVVGCPK